MIADLPVFTAITSQWVPATAERYGEIVGEQLRAELPHAAGFFAGGITFGDGGIDERVAMLRPSSALIRLWRNRAST